MENLCGGVTNFSLCFQVSGQGNTLLLVKRVSSEKQNTERQEGPWVFIPM